MINNSKIEKLRSFIKERFKGTQTFNRPGSSEDLLVPVFVEDDIIVKYCPKWDYLEIYGLTNEEYQSLSNILNIC